MTVAVFVLDLPVLTVDYQLGLLVPGDLPGPVYCILLMVEHLGDALGAGPPDGPTILVRDDMLITFAHDKAPNCGRIAAM